MLYIRLVQLSPTRAHAPPAPTCMLWRLNFYIANSRTGVFVIQPHSPADCKSELSAKCLSWIWSSVAPLERASSIHLWRKANQPLCISDLIIHCPVLTSEPSPVAQAAASTPLHEMQLLSLQLESLREKNLQICVENQWRRLCGESSSFCHWSSAPDHSFRIDHCQHISPSHDVDTRTSLIVQFAFY